MIQLASSSDLLKIRHILLHDPIWSVYAIADLQPAFAPYCHWSVGSTAEGDSVALLFTALHPPILFAIGASSALAEALAGMVLPPAVFITVQPQHYPLLEAHYDFGQKVYQMVRMVLPPSLRIVLPTGVNLQRLTRMDSEQIVTLYQHGGPYTPSYFDPYQLDDGIFYGIKDTDGALVAVGGTHIIAWEEGMATIGNMYTQPTQRGKGYARAVLGAIIAELQARTITTIVLNVDESNHVARRLYDQYGFLPYCAYLEAEGVKKIDS